MPVEPVQTLILLAVIANVAVMAAVLLPPLLGRRSPLPSMSAPAGDAIEQRTLDLAAVIAGHEQQRTSNFHSE